MATKKRQQVRGQIKVPLWAVVVTYLLCWSAGGYIIATVPTMGDWKPLAIRIVGGFLFIVWPMTGTSPTELVRAWRGESE